MSIKTVLRYIVYRFLIDTFICLNNFELHQICTNNLKKKRKNNEDKNI